LTGRRLDECGRLFFSPNQKLVSNTIARHWNTVTACGCLATQPSRWLSESGCCQPARHPRPEAARCDNPLKSPASIESSERAPRSELLRFSIGRDRWLSACCSEAQQPASGFW
jgi:hypothetical protein